MTRRLAVDIGGTFVDAIEFDDQEQTINIEKSFTTPDNPAEGVQDSISQLGLDLGDIGAFIHGTTLGVNAIIEGEGARTGILTNEGFEDVFELGRYNRPSDKIFSFEYDEPDVLVPGRRRIGVPGRINADGEVVEPLDPDAIRANVADLVENQDIQALAICFLHSYTNPSHEEKAAEIIQEEHPDLSVSISSDITKEYREYERTSTTVLNSYIKPPFESYVNELDESLKADGFSGSFFVTRSGGGALQADDAKRTPVHTVLSGPAGGIIGSSYIGDLLGRDNIIAVDMGGTSTDACVITDGAPTVKYESSIDHLPVMLPIYDIRTIGAGGGSIAWIDGELLKVGPKSAGSDPGPICYGNGGTEPTLTDAAVILGYMDPQAFLGGDVELLLDEAKQGMAEIANEIGGSVRGATKGVFDVTLGKTVSAIREITVERGLDPRDFSMVAYGGAGPMFIPLVARELGVKEVIVPTAPSVFSAWGMLMTDIVEEFSQTYLALLSDEEMETIEQEFSGLVEEARDALVGAGFDKDEIRIERQLEMRYFGQEHTLEVSMKGIEDVAQLEEKFHRHHRQRYGHETTDPIQIVHLRTRGIGETSKPEVEGSTSIDTDDGETGSQDAYCFAVDEMVEFRTVRRSDLRPGQTVQGPSIVREPTTTIVLQSDQEATVDEHGFLIIRGKEAEQ